MVLLDIAMPQRDGLDVLKALKAEAPRLPVLMLSTYPDRQYAVRSLKLGAAGYLNKSADSEQLIDAIRRVAQGKLFITPGVAELMAEQLVPAGSRSGAPEAPLHERLSHREYQVFRLLAAGRSVGEIAEQLVLSSNTVSTYRARILEKTGVRNDVDDAQSHWPPATPSSSSSSSADLFPYNIQRSSGIHRCGSFMHHCLTALFTFYKNRLI